ncbi:MAG: hypothetical protein VCD00_14770 [Candidatus Hydrogenedentota bacterium]
MQITHQRFSNAYASRANCICALVDAKRLVTMPKPMGTVLTHRIWLTTSPPMEGLPN